ncbi:hypothetical protein [Halolamina salina]|uniref:Uncharacterized protein n=1 Tax=Halolamina salina TaxID=1220023 RepID=A0ABD6B9W6_9EURY
MGTHDDLSPGDSWPHHYRGYRLTVSPDKTIWWQLYNGTDRLELEPGYAEIAENLLDEKRQGGRIHVTEQGDVLTRVEDDDEYSGVYLGNVDLDGHLLPEGQSEYRVPVRPQDLEPGDLWPSVYDGARYSFVDERVWWNNGSTNRRHTVDNGLPASVLGRLQQYKRQGGSFRITPWGDVITLIPSHPAPNLVQEQFSDLPRVVQNIIKLRKERGVEMLPIYIGNIGDWSPELSDPRSLSDALSEEEQEDLASWASSLGSTSTTTASSHKATNGSDSGESSSDSSGAEESEDDNEPRPEFEDDPMDWIRRDIEGGPE